MVLVLALQGCFDDATTGSEPATVGAPPSVFASTADIATTPFRGEFSRAPVRAATVPSAAVVVRDCSGGRDTDLPPPPPPPPQDASSPERPSTVWPGTEVRPKAPEAEAPVLAPPSVKRKTATEPIPARPREAAGKKEGKSKSKGPPRRPEPSPTRPPVDDVPEVEEELVVPQVERVWEYGARLFLSNDDSMSLASAQRILWAVQRGLQLPIDEIRPHELLNYFTFDSVPPGANRTFGVLGSATQERDTLTVALAVRGANPERQPLDLSLLVDRSCSMSAEGRMDYTRRGLGVLAENLQDGDRVDLVLFDSAVCTPVENFVVGRDDPAILRSAIAEMAPNSGTNLNLGLEAAYAIQTGRDPAEVHDRNRRVLLITDALLNEGQVDQSLVAKIGANLETHDIRLSGVGVGREFNDKMLDKLTENGKGAYVYLGSEAVVDRVFGSMFDALVRTVAHDVQFSLDLPESLAMERFYGEEASVTRSEVKPIHFYAGNTQLFLQDLHVREYGIVREHPITMRIEYRDVGSGEPKVQELRTTVGALLDADPHNVQKGQALMAFSDWVVAGALGADQCSLPLQAYRERAASLPEDAEIGFVSGLVSKQCGAQAASAAPRGVELRLRIDADQPISTVALRCATRSASNTLQGGSSVTSFASVEPGVCTVELAGVLPLSTEVTVPSAGGDLRCLVRGGQLSCT